MINGKKKARKVFEDDRSVAFLSNMPAAIGHIVLVSKGHFPILEQMPDSLVGHIFAVANRLSTATFEGLNAQGSNILVNNGIAAGQDSPHFSINIIPRRENDGLSLQWTPKQLSQEQLSAIELKITEQPTKDASVPEASRPVLGPAPSADQDIMQDDGKENYLIKSLDRIP